MNNANYIGHATEELYNIFDIINKKYFGASLQPPVITIMRTKPNIGGHFSLDKIWKKVEDKTEVAHEINVSAYSLVYDILEICHIMCHEMCHAKNKQNGIKDCSGQVHNKKFMVSAQEAGLEAIKHDRVGWTTRPSEDFKQFVADMVEEGKINAEVFFLFRDNYTAAPKDKDKKKKTKFTYRCPDCDKTFTSKSPDIRAMCEDCDGTFEKEEEGD